MRKFYFLPVLFLLLSCTSVIESARLANTQNILIQTPQAEGAKCTLDDGRGMKYKVRSTPGNVAVIEGHPPLTLICKKKGYKTLSRIVPEQKEELLTIDGERQSWFFYEQFPTRWPRLIPTAVKEGVGYAMDPLKSLSTKYPEEIVLWMEPERWASEEAMRIWAYDREVYEQSVFARMESERVKDEARKEKRRSVKHARIESRQEVIDTVKSTLSPANNIERAKEALDPRPAVQWLHEKSEELKPDWKITMPEPLKAFKGASGSVKDPKSFDPTKETSYQSGISETGKSLKKIPTYEERQRIAPWKRQEEKTSNVFSAPEIEEQTPAEGGAVKK